jgi:hypothetical protein
MNMLKKSKCLIKCILMVSISIHAQEKRNSHYITNQEPLVTQSYIQLPLGAIKPSGMLLKMLEIQRDGLTGNLDSIYHVVCGPNNGWLGGTGDGWERGPLVYALKVEEAWVQVKKEKGPYGTGGYEDPFWEVNPKSNWNYSLKNGVTPEEFKHVELKEASNMPWNIKEAPIGIRVKAKRINDWTLENGSAGKILIATRPTRYPDAPEEEILLLPYGCTTLRISQFPAW